MKKNKGSKMNDGKWETEATSDRIVTAGYIDFDVPSPATGERRKELEKLDAKLRAPQTWSQRIKSYQEIIKRGDLGDGYALGFTDNDQATDFHCEELGVEVDRKREKRLALKNRSKNGALGTQAKSADAAREQRDLWKKYRSGALDAADPKGNPIRYSKWQRSALFDHFCALHPRKRCWGRKTIKRNLAGLE